MPRDKTISRIKAPGARLRVGLPLQPKDFLRRFGSWCHRLRGVTTGLEWPEVAGCSHRPGLKTTIVAAQAA